MVNQWLVGDHVPDGVDDLSFSRGVFESDSLLFYGHQHCCRGFLRKVFDFWKVILSVGTQFSTKAPVCGEDFLP